MSERHSRLANLLFDLEKELRDASYGRNRAQRLRHFSAANPFRLTCSPLPNGCSLFSCLKCTPPSKRQKNYPRVAVLRPWRNSFLVLSKCREKNLAKVLAGMETRVLGRALKQPPEKLIEDQSSGVSKQSTTLSAISSRALAWLARC